MVKMEIPPLSLGQSFGAVFLCSNYFLLLHKSVNSGILKMKKDNRPQGGLPDYMKQKFRPYTRSKFWGGFSMRRLFLLLHKSVNGGILKMKKGQPPTRWFARLVKMEIPPYRSAKV